MNAKDKMNKKNKQGAAFTDDGFAMGEIKELPVDNREGGREKGRESILLHYSAIFYSTIVQYLHKVITLPNSFYTVL